MKKKKKGDAGLVNARDAKKRRKIEKGMRKLSAQGRKLKPVVEVEGDPLIRKQQELVYILITQFNQQL